VDKSQSAVCEIKPIALSQWLQLRAKVSKELQINRQQQWHISCCAALWNIEWPEWGSRTKTNL